MPRPRPGPNPRPNIPPPLPSWRNQMPSTPSVPTTGGPPWYDDNPNLPRNPPTYPNTNRPPNYRPPTTGGGGGGYAPPAAEPPQGPDGNWFDASSGVDGDWKDAWGNIIPHMNYAVGGGGPGSPGGGAAAAPPVPLPGAGATPPGPGLPPTFYGPTTGSPYLQLPQNWLSFLDNNTRLQMFAQLRNLGFNPLGQVGQYGEGTFARPPEFDDADFNAILDPSLRQWLRFFAGNLGYGQSYNLPGNYSGTGLPPAPPSIPPAP